MLPQKKPAKNKLKTIKKFLNGENVSDLLSLPVVKGVVTWFEKLVHEGDKPSWFDTVTINDVPVTIDQYDQILKEEKAKGNFVWQETKQYNDPEIEGVSYNNPDNIEHSDSSEPLAASLENDVTGRGAMLQDSSEAANDEIKQLTRQQLHKLHLQAELQRMKEQERIDLQVRNNCILWNKMQQQLPPL